jgi:antitoxin (DNA-binding transcriptional repressor) of toxin-antitoxin stability system
MPWLDGLVSPCTGGALCSSGGIIVNNTQEANNPQVISATTLRTKTRDILEQAKFKGEHYIVETFGKPMVAIVGIDDYWALVRRVHGTQHSTTEE